MASSREFAEFVVESLQPLGPVVARRMFGGFGIYLDGVMFALIAHDTLYLKVDDGNRPAYEDAGLPHFVYTEKGKPIRMPYREAPGRASMIPRSCATGRAPPTPPRCGPGGPSAGEPSFGCGAGSKARPCTPDLGAIGQHDERSRLSGHSR